jgi:thiol-disulfide isomerase/thioredoxin
MKKLALIATSILATAIAFAQGDVRQLEGSKAPAFKMTGTNGKTYTNASVKGKVVLLDFWATWCGPCKMASPSVQKLHEKYSKKGLLAIGANAMEQQDPSGAASKYASEHHYTYPFTVKNDAFAQKLGITGIPTFIIIDKKGIVRKVQVGFNPNQTPADLDKTISGLLAQK